MSELRISYKQIMSFDPCYDPKDIGMPQDYDASLSDFIKEYRSKVKSLNNIHWVVLRPDFFNTCDRRLFAVWSAQQVKHLMKDERSLNALIVAERFAFGEATEEEKNTAAAAAYAVAYAAVDDASYSYAVAYAAYAAAYAVADAASYSYAVAYADDAAANATADTAYADAQIDMILKMIEQPNGKWFKRV
jgi:hypothetical protein